MTVHKHILDNRGERGAFRQGGKLKALVALLVDLESREIVQHARKEQEGATGKSKFLWKKDTAPRENSQSPCNIDY